MDTDRPADAGRVLTTLGLTEVQVESTPAPAATSPDCSGAVAVEKIVPDLVDESIAVLGFAVQQPSLEDVFVGLTGEGFDVSG